MELVLAWRLNPLVEEGINTPYRAFSWQEHYTWWYSRHYWKCWIIQVTEDDFTRAVGWVALSQLDYWTPQIGFYVGEVSLWGQGVGRQAVLLGLEWLRQHGYIRVGTTVLKSNARSLNMLKGIGFTVLGEGRPDEWELQLSLPTS